jgi:hypothetical protein
MVVMTNLTMNIMANLVMIVMMIILTSVRVGGVCLGEGVGCVVQTDRGEGGGGVGGLREGGAWVRGGGHRGGGRVGGGSLRHGGRCLSRCLGLHVGVLGVDGDGVTAHLLVVDQGRGLRHLLGVHGDGVSSRLLVVVSLSLCGVLRGRLDGTRTVARAAFLMLLPGTMRNTARAGCRPGLEACLP